MTGDGARIDKQGAANALGTWDDGAASLKGQYKGRAQDVLDALGDLSWMGTGDAATAFREQFKPEEITTFLQPSADYVPGAKTQSPTGGAIVGGVGYLGQSTRAAIEQSLGADQQQADAMRKARKRASAGAHSPATSGSNSTGSTGSRSTATPPGVAPQSETPRGAGHKDDTLWHIAPVGPGHLGTGDPRPTSHQTGRDYQPLSPTATPIVRDENGGNETTSHETTRDNVLPVGYTVDPIVHDRNDNNHKATSHETTRDNILPIDQPVDGQKSRAPRPTSHETTRDNVQSTGHPTNHPVGHEQHPISHEATRDNLRPTSHEATRDNLRPTSDPVAVDQPTEHTARIAHGVIDEQPISYSDTAPQTSEPSGEQ